MSFSINKDLTNILRIPGQRTKRKKKSCTKIRIKLSRPNQRLIKQRAVEKDAHSFELVTHN